MKLLDTSRLILGTVQFGLDYGLNNAFGKPSPQEVNKILEYAQSIGVCTLDTAYAYGTANNLIGAFHDSNRKKFHVITKFKDLYSRADFSIWLNTTLNILNVEYLECCMFHSPKDYFYNTKMIDVLKLYQEKGLIKHIGISIYTNEEFEMSISCGHFDLIQIPYNLLDNKLQRGDLIESAKSKNILIHARSVFLQGLFFADKSNIPSNIDALNAYLDKIHEHLYQSKIPIAALALQYVYQNPMIDGVLIGVDSLEHLSLNIESFSYNISDSLFQYIDTLDVKETHLLYPINW